MCDSKQAQFEPYEEQERMKDYAETVVQYGFVTLFATACPLVPLLATINNIFESHIDGYKLTHSSRRPTPYTAHSIGIWENFMEITSSIAILTNVALICFTSNIFEAEGMLMRWVYFVLAEHALFSLKTFTEWMIPDTPERVHDICTRHLFVVDRLFNGRKIDDNAHLVPEGEVVNLTIHPNTVPFYTSSAPPISSEGSTDAFSRSKEAVPNYATKKLVL